MLRIRNPRQISAVGVSENEYPLNVPDDSWYVKHAWDGMDALHFEIPRGEENEELIEAEAIINTEQNYFLIKNVDARGNYIVVDAQVNIDAWRGPFWHTFRQTEITVAEALAMIKPTGWAVQMVGTYTNRKTIDNGSGEPMQDVTAFDIVGRICTIWGCVVNYDTKRKIIRVINPDTVGDSGVYLSEDVNLRAKPDFTINSADFVTRLYPYGAKDETTGLNLTIASVNDGLEYIENGQYAIDKVVSVGWTDERYTDAASLKAAAEAKLAEMANPVFSYTLALSEVDEAISMYQTVTVLATQSKQQVVEYIEYPYRHDLDSVTLSRLTPSISYDVYDNLKSRVDNIEETPPWIASDDSLGAVMIGDGLLVDDDGTVSLNLGEGLEYNAETGAVDVTGGGGSFDGRIGGPQNSYGTITQYDNSGNVAAVHGITSSYKGPGQMNFTTLDSNGRTVYWLRIFPESSYPGQGHVMSLGYTPTAAGQAVAAYTNGPNAGYNQIINGQSRINITIAPDIADFVNAEEGTAVTPAEKQIYGIAYGNANPTNIIKTDAKIWRNADGKGGTETHTYIGDRVRINTNTYQSMMEFKRVKGYDTNGDAVNDSELNIGWGYYDATAPGNMRRSKTRFYGEVDMSAAKLTQGWQDEIILKDQVTGLYFALLVKNGQITLESRDI